MNVFFIPERNTTKTIRELREIIHYRSLSVSDILVYVDDVRVIMVTIGNDVNGDTYLKELPMIAQVIDRSSTCTSIKPILFRWDFISSREGDREGLKHLQDLFSSNDLALEILTTSIKLLEKKEFKLNPSLLIKILAVKDYVPIIKKRGSDAFTDGESYSSVGKLVIVEDYFSQTMRTQYYDMTDLGKSEREALVAIRRAYPKEFGDILKRFNREMHSNIYMKK